MEQNIGKNDKIIRGIIAAGFALLGFYYSPWWYLVTALTIFTIATGFCWPYKLIGINTCKVKIK